MSPESLTYAGLLLPELMADEKAYFSESNRFDICKKQYTLHTSTEHINIFIDDIEFAQAGWEGHLALEQSIIDRLVSRYRLMRAIK